MAISEGSIWLAHWIRRQAVIVNADMGKRDVFVITDHVSPSTGGHRC